MELPDDLVFLPTALLDQRQPRGRARVRFDVSRSGKLRNLEVLSLSPEDRGAELSLRRMLRQLHFRPRFENGKAVETDGIEREYIFFDNDL